jgi:hypothetical protein
MVNSFSDVPRALSNVLGRYNGERSFHSREWSKNL